MRRGPPGTIIPHFTYKSEFKHDSHDAFGSMQEEFQRKSELGLVIISAGTNDLMACAHLVKPNEQSAMVFEDAWSTDSEACSPL